MKRAYINGQTDECGLNCLGIPQLIKEVTAEKNITLSTITNIIIIIIITENIEVS